MNFEDEEILAALEERAKKGEQPSKKRLNFPIKESFRGQKRRNEKREEEELEPVDLSDILMSEVESSAEFEERVRKKTEEFSADYDLDDLNINDRLVLRSLCQAFIALEDVEHKLYRLRIEGLDVDNIIVYRELARVAKDLRENISKLQDDLKITRRVRKTEKEQSALAFIEELKRKARDFYDAKMQKVFCPECNTWIASVWYLYPEDKNSYVVFKCNKEATDGTICKGEIKVSYRELIEMGSTKSDVPDTLK